MVVLVGSHNFNGLLEGSELVLWLKLGYGSSLGKCVSLCVCGWLGGWSTLRRLGWGSGLRSEVLGPECLMRVAVKAALRCDVCATQPKTWI